MDGARNTVGKTDVELREGVLGVNRGLREVSNGGSLNHVLHGESLDSLVLFVDSFISTWTCVARCCHVFYLPSHSSTRPSEAHHVFLSLLFSTRRRRSSLRLPVED